MGSIKVLLSLLIAGIFCLSFISAIGINNPYNPQIETPVSTSSPTIYTNTTINYNNYTNVTGGSYNASYVPYTGASSSVDLGIHNLTASDLIAGNTLYGAFLCDNFNIGCIDMRGNPWDLINVNFLVEQNITSNNYVISHGLLPAGTLTYEIGSGALRWLRLWVQNISAENIDTYTLHASDNITTDSYFIGDGSWLTGILYNYNQTTTSLPWTSITNIPSWITQVNSTPSNCSTSATYIWNVSTPYAPNASIIPNIDGSLVSWWRMDDTNSTGGVVDYMGRNNGTAFGGASQVTNGKFGDAFAFNGTGSYIGIGKVINNTSPFTMNAWVNGKQFTNSRIVTAPDDSQWYIESTGVISYYSGGTTTSSPAVVSPNVWAFLTLSYNGSVVSLYKDGILVKNQTRTTTYVGTAYSISTTGGGGFNGSIDDVIIFNRSLSSDEILSLYNATAYYHYSLTPDTGKVYIENSTADITLGVRNDNQTTTCYGGSTVNNTLDFGNVTLLANGFNVHSELFTGNALDLISKIKADSKGKTDTQGFTKIDHATIGGAMEVRAGQVTQSLDKTIAILIKANQELIDKTNTQETQIIELQNLIINLTGKDLDLTKITEQQGEAICSIKIFSWCIK